VTGTPLFGARELAEWIRAGGRPQRRIIGLNAQLWWHAHWFELNWRNQVQRLGAVEMADDPVFILGMWRSGTTVLHELLAACTGWVTPRTWQCFNPSTCFLTGAPAQETVVDRPMDRGRIASHGPQEDEFALLLLGEPSAYRAFIDPRRFGECGSLLSQNGTDVNTLPRWQCFLRGIVSTAGGTKLLLKSPGHTYRLSMLRAVFPKAKFIWIGRHTGELLASNAKMWSSMMQRYALWECPGGAMEAFFQEALRACTRVLEECLDAVPPEDLLWIDFDQLRADPKPVLGRVLRFVEPGGMAAMPQNLDQVLARIPIHAGIRASMPTDQTVRRLEQRIEAARQRFARGC
jgi:hypothetical protein